MNTGTRLFAGIAALAVIYHYLNNDVFVGLEEKECSCMGEYKKCPNSCNFGSIVSFIRKKRICTLC
jgi:hypothetical protein